MWDDCFSVRKKKIPTSLWLIFKIDKIWNVPTFSYLCNIHIYTDIKYHRTLSLHEALLLKWCGFAIDQTLFHAAHAPHASHLSDVFQQI